MSFALRLDLRQTQGLVMTPQLQQAIKLLQLSNLELAAFVERELEENPFLERVEENAAAADAATTDPATADAAPAPDPATPAEGRPLDGQQAMAEHDGGDGWAGGSDDGWADSGREPLPADMGFGDLGTSGHAGGTGFEDDALGLEGRLSRPQTLRDHLIEQLSLDFEAGPERIIGLHLIDLVDDAGYLRDDVDRLADRLGTSADAVDGVLERLQRFDPPGVFARSVRECLALQLRERDRLDPAMAALLDHLPLVAEANLPGLLRVTGVLPDDLPEMIAELKALNPKPGLAFAHETVHAVVPDIFVYPVGGGRWGVELNNATLPKVLVDTGYYAEVAHKRGDARLRAYASERFQSANWLVKALDQRARTVLRVAEAVVERQRAFLERGVRYLRPLLLRDIAEATQMHESTVSRAAAEKYVATPRGNLPFKYFFSNALPGADGETGHAAEAIRQQIKVLIAREAPARVLSDDQIVDILRTSGVVIARRTVAKYRESLAIPSSVQRRRSKALKLA
jgi:RNA polymerase sigma-54 factor